MYDKYIDKFMPSKNMSEYLKTQELTPKQITSLIFNSPKSIECKLKSLESLTKEADDDNLHYWCNQYINAIKYAKEHLVSAGVFDVYSYYIKNQKPDECHEGLFLNFEHIKEYIAEDKEYFEIPDNAYFFYKLVKWKKDKSGHLDDAITYYLVNDEIWYFTLGVRQEKELGVEWDTNDFDLNVPTPFSVGDIVEFDNFPFNKRTYSIILYADNDYDCCSPWNLYWSGKNKWSAGAVEHGQVGFYPGHFNYFDNPIICPVYNAKLYEGELPRKYKILEMVKQACETDKEKYNKLDKLINASIMSEEELLKIIESIK